MFYDNISLTNKEKLLKSIPKFEEERIFYFRHEKGNKKSFAIVNGKTQEMVMNGEAWEILKLCNGERIVEQIKEDFATRYSLGKYLLHIKCMQIIQNIHIIIAQQIGIKD